MTDEETASGSGVQIEVDALEPARLRQLFADAIEHYWDTDAYDAVMATERDDIEKFNDIVDGLEDGSPHMVGDDEDDEDDEE